MSTPLKPAEIRTMNTPTTSLNNRRAILLTGALSVMLSGATAAGAQATDAIMGGEDSLLPPEVVPLEPEAANAMAQKQAALRAAQMTAGPTTAPMVPGMPAGMQTSQDATKAAYASLMGNNGQLPAQFANRAGQGLSMNPPGLASANGSQLGQSPLVQPGQSIPQGQSQTLSGGVKYKPVQHDTRRGGFSNALSAVAGIGSGILVGGLVRRPSTALGVGMFGVGLSGFGSRGFGL